MDSKISIDDIISKFNKSMSKIINLVDSKIKDNSRYVQEMNRLKNIIKLAKAIGPETIIERCKDKICAVEASTAIQERNAKFFLERKYDDYVKKDENQIFIETLIQMVKNGYPRLSDNEKIFCWKHADMLLWCCANYKKMVDV